MNTYFPSKKGALMWTVAVALVIMAAVQMYFSMSSGAKGIIIIMLVIWVPVLSLVLTIFFGTRYTIEGGELLIKIGPVVYGRIKAGTIKSAKRSFNPMASPANSLRRLELKYEGGMVLISPEREEEFIQLLTNLNPQIQVSL